MLEGEIKLVVRCEDGAPFFEMETNLSGDLIELARGYAVLVDAATTIAGRLAADIVKAYGTGEAWRYVSEFERVLDVLGKNPTVNQNGSWTKLTEVP